LKDVTASLQNVRSTPKNLIRADRISLTSPGSKVKGFMQNVVIDNMLLDDLDETILIDGIRWQSASLNVQTGNEQKGKGSKKSGGNIQLKNINGGNTDLVFRQGETIAATSVNSVKLASLVKEGDRPVRIAGLAISGKNISVNGAGTKVAVAQYRIVGNAESTLSGLSYERLKDRDSLILSAPRLDFTGDINGLLANDIHLTNVQVQQPVIKLVKWNNVKKEDVQQSDAPLRIDRIRATEPVINITLHKGDSMSMINLPRSQNSMVQASGLQINSRGVQLGSVSAKTTAATFVKPTGEVVGVEDGLVDLQVSNLLLLRKEGIPTWSGMVNVLNLQNPTPLRLGKAEILC
jgi:hypothetical protein